VDEKRRIPGRFAIDFIKLNDQGLYANGSDNEIKNWYGYGADVLAVSDGVVASVRDDFSESATLSEHPRYPADKATGNYISIDIGKERVVFYEHLKPGSTKVKPGQKIKKGDVIAALGFTGQTTGPHLHFHVADKNSPLGAEGIPFVFERFTVLGSYADMEKFGKELWTPVKNSNQMIREERPGPNAVIEF
jgi:murein DD-endopeptidase MepM/ murein hydrolase activator NlpD